MFAAPDHDLTPASAYNWGQTDDNSSPTDFFNEFAPKPKKVRLLVKCAKHVSVFVILLP